MFRSAAVALLATLSPIGFAHGKVDLTTENKPKYNWLAVPYQMKGTYSTFRGSELTDMLDPDSDWDNPLDCELIMHRAGEDYAECWTGLKSNYFSRACQDNDEDVKYKGLKCQAGFYSEYKTRRGMNPSMFDSCLDPPERPVQYGYDSGSKTTCDLILEDTDPDVPIGSSIYCYIGLDYDKFLDAAEHKRVKGTQVYLWIDEAPEQCYF